MSRFSRTVICGQSCRASGTITSPRSTSLKAGRPVTSSPWKRMVPRRGLRRPAMVRRVVVFPAPFAPTRVTISPGSTSKETSQTAWTSR